MVKYFYNKYSTTETRRYNEGSWISVSDNGSMIFTGFAKSYTYDSVNNYYTVSSSTWTESDSVSTGSVAYHKIGAELYRYTSNVTGTVNAWNYIPCVIHKKTPTSFTYTTTYARGGLFQSNLIAENGTYPSNGLHTDGYWYVHGAIVNNAPKWATIPIQLVKKNAFITINLKNFVSDVDGDVLTFSIVGNSGPDTNIATIELSGSVLKITGVSLGSTNLGLIVTDGISNSQTTMGITVANSEPIVTITSPSNNGTLYENDVFNITGTVTDADNGNSVTVRYQIGATTVRAIKAFLSDGSTLEAFSKILTFKGGNLYDGTTLIAENLSDGVAHTLKVWATDDQGGTSAIREIPFYVVPNRAPLLTVNAPVISGLINSDKFKVNGTFEDSDGNNTIVSYRLNGASSVQVAEGVNGSFEFELSFGQLVIGANEIVIEAVDSYGAKVSKTVKLDKAAVATPLLKSTVRYKINPPSGSARGVLLWIQRDENLDIDVSISMTMQGEAESFVPLTVSNSAPLDQNSPIIEDEFYHEADGTKDNIILQIDMERASLDVSDKIYLISGVLD